MFLNHPFAALGVAMLVGLAAVAVGVLLPTATVLVWMEEDGPVESWTLMLYFLAALGVCGDRERLHAPVWPAMVTLLVAAAGRELDWHKEFTGVSVMKLGYYVGSAPAAHKVLAVSLLSAMALAGLYLAWRFAGWLWRGLRGAYPPACTVLTLLAVLVFCKLADRSLGVLAEDFGIRSSGQARALQLSLEESLEMALPALVLLGLVQGRSAAPAQPRSSRRRRWAHRARIGAAAFR